MRISFATHSRRLRKASFRRFAALVPQDTGVVVANRDDGNTRDVVAGLPRVELTGSRELRMENHRGILAYGSQEIHISGGKLVIKVRGSDLELKSMNASQLLITGEIDGVDLT